MRNVKRPRRYVSSFWLTVLRPVLRHSETREAYVLRLVGRQWGPVLRRDRRRGRSESPGRERRGTATVA